MKESNKVVSILNLNILLLVYSLISVCSKNASQCEMLSMPFIFWYGLVVVILGLYAIFWQQLIKKLPLNTAYANKAVTIVWGILWGALFFKEAITWNMILGAVIVIAGVVLVVSADE